MGENSATIEYVRVALALGVILSMMIYERQRWTGTAALVAKWRYLDGDKGHRPQEGGGQQGNSSTTRHGKAV